MNLLQANALSHYLGKQRKQQHICSKKNAGYIYKNTNDASHIQAFCVTYILLLRKLI